jgi:3'(2'), 5'-bisphosphate nucleotidase
MSELIEPLDPDDGEEVLAEDDHELALRLAVEAGKRLVMLRDDLFARGHPGWRVMDEGDLAAHRFLVACLAEARPLDPVLSEEGVDQSDRLQSTRVWIVDPLDGTNEYGEGRPDWAVHVALVEDGTPVAAAVSLPAMGRVYGTRPAAVLPDVSHRRPRFVVSRFRAAYSTMALASALGADVLRMGSAGAKAMAVVSGEADVYAHAGGMYEWDSCAPAAVAAAAGLHVSRIDGTPLVYNRPDPWLPDLLICRRELADDVLTHLWS